MRSIRILAADPHGIVRAGVRALLQAQADMEVVAEASDAQGAVNEARARLPDIVILAISMPGGGLSAVRGIRSGSPNCRAIVLTTYEDAAHLRQALHAGASGYVPKRATEADLIQAIRTVDHGDLYVHPSMLRHLLAGELSRLSSIRGRREGEHLLSEREREVLQLTALGYSHQQTAERLFLSVKTVETYKARLMGKLNMRGRAELVRYAMARGWLQPECDNEEAVSAPAA